MSTIKSDLKVSVMQGNADMQNGCRQLLERIEVPEFTQAFDSLCDAILELVLAKVDTKKVEGNFDNAVLVISARYCRALSAVVEEII